MFIAGLVLGLVLGFFAAFAVIKVIDRTLLQKKIDEKIDIFKDILNSIDKNQIKFINRVNNTVGFSILTSRVGIVELVYTLDKGELAILQKGNCLFTSSGIGDELINKICFRLNNQFGKDIEDVTDVHGNIIDNKTIKRVTNNIGNMSSGLGLPLPPKEPEFDIDELLDKISKSGVESLSKNEKEYLDNLNNDT